MLEKLKENRPLFQPQLFWTVALASNAWLPNMTAGAVGYAVLGCSSREIQNIPLQQQLQTGLWWEATGRSMKKKKKGGYIQTNLGNSA